LGWGGLSWSNLGWGGLGWEFVESRKAHFHKSTTINGASPMSCHANRQEIRNTT